MPVICQATLGWTNTGGDYGWRAATKSPKGVRETATSYMTIRSLARHWLYADGIVMTDGRRHSLARSLPSLQRYGLLPEQPPHTLWLRESDWAVILNPGDHPAEVDITLHYGSTTRAQIVTVPPRRLKRLYMDEIAPRNLSYGVWLPARGGSPSSGFARSPGMTPRS